MQDIKQLLFHAHPGKIWLRQYHPSGNQIIYFLTISLHTSATASCQVLAEMPILYTRRTAHWAYSQHSLCTSLGF